jgi:hypothetical protein
MSTFKRDLIIATWDEEKNEKVLYQVSESEWKKTKADPKVAADLDAMLNQGAILAAVPELGNKGVACYLVNVASINVDPYADKAKGRGK